MAAGGLRVASSLHTLPARPGRVPADSAAVDLDARTPAYVDVEPGAGARVRSLAVAVIGAGSVGARIAMHTRATAR